MKPTLIVVKSPQNDDNSESYSNRISSYWDKYYKEDINLQTIDIDSQDLLDLYLSINKGSVLLLEPTDLKINSSFVHRDIENDQVVDAILDNLPNPIYCNKILLLGSSHINEKLDDKLRFNKRIIATCAQRDMAFLNDDFLSYFDTIINCTRYDAEVKLFYTNTVIDVSGNFKVETQVDKNFETNIDTVRTPNPGVISRGVIGLHTTGKLMEDVISNGQ